VTGPALGVTGSTGALGGPVAHDLAGSGVAQRLLLRAPEGAPTHEVSEVIDDVRRLSGREPLGHRDLLGGRA
jgi:hypothetical protein